jgi:tetratricopeptide (TPR) repeat protein
MNSRLKILLTIIFPLIIVSQILAQNDDQNAFKEISSISNPDKQIEALQNFVSKYPKSDYLLQAYFELVNLYADKKDEANALKYGDMFINTYPEAARMNAYNSIAYSLAEKKIGLKTAADYAQKAVDLAKNGNPRMLNMILDTQALVLYDLGNADSALVLEREAFKGNEDDPSFLYYLSMYEAATGHTNDALMHSASAILLGDPGKAAEKFNEWLKKAKPTEKEQTELKNKIATTVAENYLKDSEEKDNLLKKSNAAAFLAKMGVDLKKNEKIANDAVKSAGKNTSLENLLTLKSNVAIVHSAMGENKKAIEELNSVKDLASPYDGDFWFTLGKAYESIGNKDEVLNSYIQGLVAYENPKIKAAVDEFMARNKIDPNTLKTRINKEKEQMLNFKPGKYDKKNSTGRVVLAELFTGAECPPCVAADKAFDMLSEFYPRKDVVILEYHLHIPGPDPMTNPETFKRYRYYGGNFGTPTVFFNGGNQITSGGADFVAPNRFNVYEHIINQDLKEKPGYDITGTAKLDKNNSVKVNIDLKKLDSKDKNLSVHIALVEKSIAYVGGNGISKHMFVVRDLANGPDGEEFDPYKNNEKITRIFDLANIENGIKSYLDNPTKDPSWRGNFTGWKARPDNIDHNNLAVVVWVQDNNTKNIQQAFYANVTKDFSSK